MKMKETHKWGGKQNFNAGTYQLKEVEYQKNGKKLMYQTTSSVKNEGKPSFVLHDSPPMLMVHFIRGHALNKISKDFIVRSKSMSGSRAPYVPGGDTHGLPIQQALFEC